MKRIIITGAGGYIGQNLIKVLGEEHELVCVDIESSPSFGQLKNNPKTRWVTPEGLQTLSGTCDVLYNLAWVGKGGPLRADYQLQTQNVLNALAFYKEAVRLGCKRYISAGTIGELMVQLSECAKIRSQNFVYINAKNYLHSILNNIEESDKCKVVWARLGNLFGGGNSGGNLADYTINTLKRGERAQFGPAEQPYDFIHAVDGARALVALGLTESLTSNEYYIGAGDVRLLKDYLHAIGRGMGKDDLVGVGCRPDDGTRYKKEWFSIDRLVAETGFSPTKSFEEWLQFELEGAK